MAAALEFKRRVRPIPELAVRRVREPRSRVLIYGLSGWLTALLLGYGIQSGRLPVRQWVIDYEEHRAGAALNSATETLGLTQEEVDLLFDSESPRLPPATPPVPSSSPTRGELPQAVNGNFEDPPASDPLPAAEVGAREAGSAGDLESLASGATSEIRESDPASTESGRVERLPSKPRRAGTGPARRASATPSFAPDPPELGLTESPSEASESSGLPPEIRIAGLDSALYGAHSEGRSSLSGAPPDAPHNPAQQRGAIRESEPRHRETEAAAGALISTPLSGTCEGAIKDYREEIVIGGGRGDPDISRSQYAAILENGSWFRNCDVPNHLRVDVCVAVRHGRAVGVTVQTSPSHRGQERCIANAARRLHFPSNPRLDVTNTSFLPG